MDSLKGKLVAAGHLAPLPQPCQGLGHIPEEFLNQQIPICILSNNLDDMGEIPSAITHEEVLGLSEGSLNQLPRSPSDGRVGVDLIRVGSVGNIGGLD